MRLFYRNNYIYIFIIFIIYIYFEQSLVPCSNQGRGLLSGGANVLAACYACYETPTHRHPKKQALNKLNKQKAHGKAGNDINRQDGRKEGGKEARTAARKKRRSSSRMRHRVSKLHMLLSKRCKPQAISIASTLQLKETTCYMLQIPCHLQLWASGSCRLAFNLQMLISKCRKNYAVFK